MSLFGEGLGTYPDTLFIVSLITFTLLSTILNPLVFIYNHHKSNSLPKFLFQILSVLDFTTCLYFSAHHVKSIAERAPPKCYPHDKYGALCAGFINRSLTTQQKVVTVVGSILFKSPSCVTALLTVCRFRQLKFPFRRLKVKFCVVFAVLYLSYSVLIQYYSVSDKTAFYFDPLGAVITVNLFTGSKFNITSPIKVFFIQHWPLLTCQLASIIASLGTISHLWSKTYKVEPTPRLSRQQSQDGKRRTTKILITNIGSLILTIALTKILAMLVCSADSKKLNMAQFYVSFIVYVLLPTFLSCLNPVIFLLLTPQARVPAVYCPKFPWGRYGSSGAHLVNSNSFPRDVIKLHGALTPKIQVQSETHDEGMI